MKRIRLLSAASMLFLAVSALSARTPENVEYVFTEASDLTLTGKILEDTPNPYHRVDTCRYKGFTSGENIQVRCSAGLFKIFGAVEHSPVSV